MFTGDPEGDGAYQEACPKKGEKEKVRHHVRLIALLIINPN
jgi:hypothetical protein